MKYTIDNRGTGVVMIRVFIPETQVSSFLAFIDSKSRENVPQIRKPSPLHDENYFIKLGKSALITYESFISDGLPSTVAISETLKRLKSGKYFNISYDQLKQILSKNGCFRAKNNEKSLI